MTQTNQAEKQLLESCESGRTCLRASDSHRRFPTVFFGVAFFFCSVWGPGPAIAQVYDTLHVVDTSSPRDTLRSFIDATNEIRDLIRSTSYFDRSDPEHMAIAQKVLDCIDDSQLPAFARIERAGEVAVCLKEILDRVELPPWEEVPDNEEIVAAGGLEALTDYRIPDTRITISRVEQGPRRHEYLFSPGTVDRAVAYFQSIESKPYVPRGRKCPRTSIGGTSPHRAIQR